VPNPAHESTRPPASPRRPRTLRPFLTLFLAGLAAAALLLLTAPAAFAFSDVPADSRYAAAIDALAQRHVVSGYEDGTFRPSDTVTRQQFAKMIVLALELPVSEGDACNFWDVTKSTDGTLYPDHYIAVAAARGITKGVTATSFAPLSDVGRAQVVTMAVRSLDKLHDGVLEEPPALYTGCTWRPSFSAAHGENARRAEFNGLLARLPLTSLDPWGGMTRAETAQVLWNLMKLVASPHSAKIVVVDPGHQARGNYDEEPIGPGSSITKPKVSSGTAGVVTGIDESELNLAVSLMLRDELEARGVRVIMTRTRQDVDISNIERTELANQVGADLFLRVHADGMDDSGAHGIHTLYPATIPGWTDDIAAASKRAAQLVQTALVSATGAYDRGLDPRDDMTGFNWSDVPVVIPEMGFMSNPAEDRLLAQDSYRRKLAVALAQAAAKFVGER
jgi:N-acetylmuramoyl-L-alanine amidase